MIETYRVLARKYRPQTLADLVGQDVLVQTLTKSIISHKLPHAFVLYGMRGVGKTTTARIIAKTLNCTKESVDAHPPLHPCGECSSCLAITQDRHIDVVEMDAASRTGVDDIREVIEASRYKAVYGRYKIYIIDEVHMLSKSAFNALLKTLEEPPPHVKFIFATTELEKIPETVLSRCMKLSLSRIEGGILRDLFNRIAIQEKVTIEEEALALLVRAADGSARDGLSLLDQAIALSGEQVTTDSVRKMLGSSDRGRLFDVIDALFSSRVPEVLSEIRAFYQKGGDPTGFLKDLLDLIHWIICLKITPSLSHDQTWPLNDREQGGALSKKLSIGSLSQAWQVLCKGYEEVMRSPLPQQACEMVLIRLCYLAELPDASDLALLLENTQSQPSLSSQKPPLMESTIFPSQGEISTPTAKTPQSFEDILSLVAKAREPLLYSYLMQDVHLVAFTPYRIELRLNDRAPKPLPQELEKFLLHHTGEKWEIVPSSKEGDATFSDKKNQQQQEINSQALTHPFVQEIMTAFPSAKASVKTKT